MDNLLIGQACSPDGTVNLLVACATPSIIYHSRPAPYRRPGRKVVVLKEGEQAGHGRPHVERGLRGVRLPHRDRGWAEAEPGMPWLKLDEELRLRDMGLAVYPTSAPRATVGGWLATDGLGVGSFEYGRLRENVLSASVVLPGGERREVQGKELGSFLSTGTAKGIVVGARLRTRQADADTPFAAVFEDATDLTGAVTDLFDRSVPLWHLAVLDPAMARARNLGTTHVMSEPTHRNGPGRSSTDSAA